MPDISTLLTFALALLVLEITPGPDMMLVLARGIGQGRRVALLTVVGMVFLAGVVQVALLVLGVASLLKAYPASLLLLQWAGAAYLLYLGAKMIAASRHAGERRRPETAPVADGQGYGGSAGGACQFQQPPGIGSANTYMPARADGKCIAADAG